MHVIRLISIFRDFILEVPKLIPFFAPKLIGHLCVRVSPHGQLQLHGIDIFRYEIH